MVSAARSDVVSKLVQGGAGLLTAALGLAVILVGWGQFHSLDRAVEGPAVTWFTTALGLALAGAGLACVAWGWRQIGRGCAFLAIALGAVALFEFFTEIDLGLSALSDPPSLADSFPLFRRLSPPSALALLLTGIAVALMSSGPSPARSVELTILASVVLAIALFSLLGNLTVLEIRLGWTQVLGMAVHTAAGFLLLAIGMLARVWSPQTGQGKGLRQWLALPVGAGLVTLTLAFSLALLSHERENVERETVAAAAALRTVANNTIRDRVVGLLRMASRWEILAAEPEDGTEERKRRTDASLYLRHYLGHRPKYFAISRIDSQGIVRWTEPPHRLGELLGGRVDSMGALRAMLRSSQEDGTPRLTTAIDLPGVGAALLLFVPLQARGLFEGFLMGIFPSQELIEEILAEAAIPGFEFEIYDHDRLVHARREEAGTPAPEVIRETQLSVLNMSWRLKVWPTGETLHSVRGDLPEISLAAGLLLSALMALAVFLGQSTLLRGRILAEANQQLRQQIAERERAEQELSSANQSLAALNRELESFSYSVSHDLRQPLRGMTGFSHALLEDYGESLDAQAQDYLRRIDRAALRMTRLIDDLLALSRITRGELSKAKVDMTEVAREIADELRLQDSDRRVEFRIAEGLTTLGDPRLLRVMLQNLLGNAWKFTGKVDRALIELGEEQADGATAFFVRDNGVGFDMRYADKLFAPFQRLHSEAEFPGTGIGLATIQRIVARHGGRVWARSWPGEGTVFYFTL
jgi:signal transduction histidine kinase